MTTQTVFPIELKWESEKSSRIPFMAYTDEALHKKELQRFFYEKHWCYVGLEAEIPNPGDFKRTAIGERSVIMVRDRHGEINVVENLCAHRGVAFRSRLHDRERVGLPGARIAHVERARRARRFSLAHVPSSP